MTLITFLEVALAIVLPVYSVTFAILMILSGWRMRFIGLKVMRRIYWFLALWVCCFLAVGGGFWLAGASGELWFDMIRMGAIGVITLGGMYYIVFKLPKRIPAIWKWPDQEG